MASLPTTHDHIQESGMALRYPDDEQKPLLSEKVSRTVQQSFWSQRWVTVEPCILLYFAGSIGLLPLTNQYVLHFIQKQNNFSMESANGSEYNHTSDPNYIKEQEIQSQASSTVILFTVVALIPSLFITVQLGGYSDKAGRKITLVFPLIGAILRSLISAFIVYSELPLPLFNVAYFIEGVMGGMSTLVMACFAYIADVTSHKNRSFRIFLLEMAVGVGIIISSISIGFLIQTLGFMYPYLILCGIHVLNLLYIVTILRESIKKDPTAQFFTARYYISMLTLYFKNDGTGRRWKLLLSLLILFLVCIPHLGGNGVLFYFQLSSPISFDSVDIGLWEASRYMVVSMSGILALNLFHSRLGDVGLMVVGCVFSIAFYTSLTFIMSKFMMYLATLIGVFSSLTIPMVRSFSSKIIKPNEHGTMFSAIAVVQAISIPVASVILNSIYSATVQFSYMRGTTFLVEAGMEVVSFLLVLTLIIGLRVEKKHSHTSAIHL